MSFKIGDKVGWTTDNNNGRYTTIRRTEGYIKSFVKNKATIQVTKVEEAVLSRNLYEVDITLPYTTVRTAKLFKI